MVSASMAKAKLSASTVERSVVTMNHNYSQMTEEELRDEIAAITAEARALKSGSAALTDGPGVALRRMLAQWHGRRQRESPPTANSSQNG